MAEMTVAEGRKIYCDPSIKHLEGPVGCCPVCLAYRLIGDATAVQDQRDCWLAANPDQPDDFKPLDQCTEDELLAELNSTMYRSAG